MTLLRLILNERFAEERDVSLASSNLRASSWSSDSRTIGEDGALNDSRLTESISSYIGFLQVWGRRTTVGGVWTRLEDGEFPGVSSSLLDTVEMFFFLLELNVGEVSASENPESCVSHAKVDDKRS